MSESEIVAWLSLFVAIVALLVGVYFARRPSGDAKALGSRIDRVGEVVEGAREDEIDRDVAHAVGQTRQASAQRGANLRARLRSEYVASHDGISPSLMAGNADPPQDRCRAKLLEWRVDEREIYG